MHTLAKQRRIFILISLAVPVLLLVGFVVFPAVDLFRMSFTDWDGLSPTSNFIWFENYIDMFPYNTVSFKAEKPLSPDR